MGAILLILSALGTVQTGPREAIVADESLEVFDAPEPGALPTGQLRRGQKVRIEREDPGGWLAILPPRGTFSWIDADAIEEIEDDQARVLADGTSVRPGRPGARLPGAAQITLDAGAVVQLLDRPELVVGQGPAARRWAAIVPPRGEFRYILADGVDIVTPARRPGRPIRDGEGASSLPTSIADAGFRNDLQRAEALHRAATAGPIEQWDLGRVRDAYTRLLDQTEDAEARRIVGERLANLDRQRDLISASSGFLTQLRASRLRDDELGRSREKLHRNGGPIGARPVAEGYLVPSAVELGGHPLHALFGRDGKLTAYLDLPAGLMTRDYIGRRVGAIGEARYLEDLPVRVVTVRDLITLDDRP